MKKCKTANFFEKNSTLLFQKIGDFIPIIVGTFFTILILVLFSKKISCVKDFLLAPISSKYYFGLMLNNAFLLMISGSAAIIPLTAGEFNLGGEGQIYIAGFASALAFHLTKNFHPIISFLISLFFAIFAPSVLTFFSSILKELKNASILLTTFLISSAIIPFVDSLVAGPFRGENTNLLALPFLKDQLKSPLILKPSPLSLIALISPIICVALYFIIYKTSQGRRIQITGISNEFAKYSGYNLFAILSSTLFASSALYGLTGFIYVVGVHHTCHQGFYIGAGWNSITCALLAKKNPLFLIPASIILSLIFTSANKVALYNNFGFDTSALIQGIMLLCIAASYSIKREI